MEASEPKLVNPNVIQYGVNSFRLGDLQIEHLFSRLKTSGKQLGAINSKVPPHIAEIISWMPWSLSELTPIIFNMELTHLSLDSSILKL